MWGLLCMVLSVTLADVNSGQVETILEFSRALDTCDSQDVPISTGTSSLIYAYSDTDQLTKHKVKGSRSLRLFQERNTHRPVEKDLVYEDVRMPNISIPFDNNLTGPTTTYYCTGIRLSVPFGEKVHVVKWEALISPANREFIHHILLFDCGTLSNSTVGTSGHCYDGGPEALRDCSRGNLVAGWAVGGLDVYFPPHVGYPLGETSHQNFSRYLLMEIHYDNPERKEIIDDTGLRLTYTRQLRKHDAGAIILGAITHKMMTIPAQSKFYEHNTWCPPRCTKDLLTAGSVSLLGGLLHTHKAGRGVTVQHVRNGTELSTVQNESNYDFNLQDFELFKDEVVIMPGDSFYTQCVYDTLNRNNDTNFGLSTMEEMCLATFLYYPRVNGSKNGNCIYANISSKEYVVCESGLLEAGEATMPKIKTPRKAAAPCNRSVPPNSTLVVRDVNDFSPGAYTRHEYLDTKNNVMLHWRTEKNIIRFALQVNTAGWVALGFSKNKGMVGSDIVLGYVRDGQGFAADRYAREKALPVEDAQQDIFDVVLSQGIRTLSSQPHVQQGQQAANKNPETRIDAFFWIPIVLALALPLLCLFWIIMRMRHKQHTVQPTDKSASTRAAVPLEEAPR